MKKYLSGIMALALAAAATSCSDDPKEPTGPEPDQQGEPMAIAGYSGMYILNEGAFGQNQARIDKLDFSTGAYYEDLYVKSNPDVVMALGDVGNDLQLNGNRLYAVVNGSHKVEVMQASTLKRIGQVDISSPRAIAFDGSLAYVSSWVDGGNDNGSVVIFNTQSLKTVGSISVGQEPEGVAVANGKLYVGCSGGMHATYSDELWVIDLATLVVERKITVAPNIHRVVADADGSLWVSARGNYVDVGSGLYHVVGNTVTSMNVPCAGFALGQDKIYYYASEWSNVTMSSQVTYGTIDRATLTPGASFITDGTQSSIENPYGVFTAGGTVFVADARNYTSSGAMYVYDADGKRQQTFTTGVCPASVVFLPKNR